MKRYTINLDKKNIFRTNNNTANASKNLDDLILGNLIKMNPYLGYKKAADTDPTLTAAIKELKKYNEDKIIYIPISSSLKGDYDTEFARAAKFLANYKPNKSLKLSDDTIIKFFEDEIQIGYDLIPLYDLTCPARFNSFSDDIKNIIINIYITING